MKLDTLFDFFKNTKRLKFSLIVIFLYFFFLVISLPASVFISFVTLPQNLKYSSVSGTIWSGFINEVKIETTGLELGTINWQLHPLNLIMGELAADISVVKGSEYLNSYIKIRSSGKLELQESRFLINLISLKPLTYAMPFSYSGNISGYFPAAFIYLNNHIILDGELNANEIKLTSPQVISFGDFTFDFRAEKEGATTVKVKDLGGPLMLSGQMMLDKNAYIRILSKLSARDKGSEVEKILSLMGKKDSTGRVEFNYNHQL